MLVQADPAPKAPPQGHVSCFLTLPFLVSLTSMLNSEPLDLSLDLSQVTLRRVLVHVEWMLRGLQAEECDVQQEGWQMQQTLTRNGHWEQIFDRSSSKVMDPCFEFQTDIKGVLDSRGWQALECNPYVPGCIPT